jgi:hypothetical protein
MCGSIDFRSSRTPATSAANGSEWATRQGKPALLNRWRLTRDDWEQRRRDDIQLHNIEACHALLPLS